MPVRSPVSFATLPGRVRRHRDAIGTWRLAVAVALLVAVGLVQVYLRLQVVEAGYAISRESRLRHDLEDQQQKLRIELLTRRDPAVIERRAREELGMAPADPSAIRTVRLTTALAEGRAP